VNIRTAEALRAMHTDRALDPARLARDNRRLYGLLPRVSKKSVRVIKIGCSHISGLCWSRGGFGPWWASAHREPISETRPHKVNGVSGLSRRRSDRSRHRFFCCAPRRV